MNTFIRVSTCFQPRNDAVGPALVVSSHWLQLTLRQFSLRWTKKSDISFTDLYIYTYRRETVWLFGRRPVGRSLVRSPGSREPSALQVPRSDQVRGRVQVRGLWPSSDRFLHLRRQPSVLPSRNVFRRIADKTREPGLRLRAQRILPDSGWVITK